MMTRIIITNAFTALAFFAGLSLGDAIFDKPVAWVTNAIIATVVGLVWIAADLWLQRPARGT